ncbi:DMT family transporter [Salinimicrobium sp. GXAS 041]|uniref:DMT family transporter n=1 Tax=Salinimicrobium sp. GXAS 041 TaxID=3400806 RepID=UPI003C76A23F
MKKKIILLSIGFVLLWNSGFIGAEYGLPYTGPFTLIFWRYLAVTLLIAVYLILRKRLKWIGFRAASLNMLIGFLAHGVWLTCVLFALDNEVPAGIVALVVALQPLATGALSGYVTSEKTGTYQWWGLIAGFVGVAVTVGFRIGDGNSGSIFGYLIPLCSVIGITIATLIQRRMEITNDSAKLPLDQTLFYQSFATVLVLLFPAYFLENFQTQWKPQFVYAMLWLIVGVSLGAYILMWSLIDRLDATRVASLFYLGPPVTMLMGWMAFGDSIITTDVVGIVIVFVGVLLTQRN